MDELDKRLLKLFAAFSLIAISCGLVNAIIPDSVRTDFEKIELSGFADFFVHIVVAFLVINLVLFAVALIFGLPDDK
jgi:hypothetical protein